MAAKTPVTKGTTGYVDPQRGYFGGVTTSDLVTDGRAYSGKEGLKVYTVYFADIDNGDTWTSNIEQIRFVAFQSRTTADIVLAALTSQATGVVTFLTSSSNLKGWLHVFYGGAGS